MNIQVTIIREDATSTAHTVTSWTEVATVAIGADDRAIAQQKVDAEFGGTAASARVLAVYAAMPNKSAERHTVAQLRIDLERGDIAEADAANKGA